MFYRHATVSTAHCARTFIRKICRQHKDILAAWQIPRKPARATAKPQGSIALIVQLLQGTGRHNAPPFPLQAAGQEPTTHKEPS